MSIIQSIRDKGAWIVFTVIALALIAFILQDGVGRNATLTQDAVLGKVNGKTISYGEFSQQVALYGGNQEAATAIPQVWEKTVDETLLEQEYKRLGLTVTGNELGTILFSNQSPLANIPQFRDANGNFKAEEARQIFTSLKKSKNATEIEGVVQQIINPLEKQLLVYKYQSLLYTPSTYVPNWFIEKQKANLANTASIDAVFVPYSTIKDADIKVSGKEIYQYIRQHPAIFMQAHETRTVDYVSFSTAPTQADSNLVLNNLLAQKNGFATTDNMTEFILKANSEVPYFDGYILKNNIKVPNAAAIIQQPIGQVYGPYIDGNNYVLARLIGTRKMADSVQVRHILVKTKENGQTVLADSVAEKRIDSAIALAKSGVDFGQLVQTYSDDLGSKAKGGMYDFTSTQASSISKEFADFVFFEKTGDKKLVKVNNNAYSGYHYIEILNQKNVGEAVKIAYLAKPIMPSNSTINEANSKAMNFAVQAKNNNAFKNTASKDSLNISQTQEFRINDFTIPNNFGQANMRQLIRWAYKNKVGKVGEPTEIGNAIIVPIINAINPEGYTRVAVARPYVEPILRNKKKAKIIVDTKLKGNSLEEIAKNATTLVEKIDSISFFNPTLKIIGYDNKVLGAAFNPSLVNKISSPIAGNAGVVVLKVNTITALPMAMDNQIIQQNIVQMQQSNTSIYNVLNALKKQYTIKEYLYEFY